MSAQINYKGFAILKMSEGPEPYQVDVDRFDEDGFECFWTLQRAKRFIDRYLKEVGE